MEKNQYGRRTKPVWCLISEESMPVMRQWATLSHSAKRSSMRRAENRSSDLANDRCQ